MRPALLLVVLLLAGCAAPERGQDAPSPPVVVVVEEPAAPPTFASDAPAPAPPAAPGVPTGLELLATADAPGGYNLRVHEGRAYVATFTGEEGVAVFDVTDPASPTHLGGIMGTLARSVDVLDWGARVGVAISTGTELEVWEMTDPAEPVRLASFPFGSHNVAVHHGANVVYNARNVQDGVGGAMEIVDASDPDDVRLDRTWTFPLAAEDGSLVHDQGCHDLSVWPEAGRAYCAAYEETLVLDVTDALHPTILTVVDDPRITSHHTAFPILDASVLVISDEFVDNFAWGCIGGSAGTLWFFDMDTHEVLGTLEAPVATPSRLDLLVPLQGAMCTSHNGEELGPGSGFIGYGWFHAGVMLIDARDPSAPVVLDLVDHGGAVGDARWYEGRLYAADDEVGLAVFDVTGNA